MSRARPVPLFAAMALVCSGAYAQSQAPGLWEHTLNLSSKGGEMAQALTMAQQQLAALPPEQRRQIEQMMGSRGISVAATGTTIKACVTPEQAARPAEPQLPDGCTQEVVQRRSNSLKVRYECTKPRPARGEADIAFTSDKAYTGTSTVTTEVNGAPQKMNVTMSGKWLASDCGDVKPISVR